jgi:hypothetical protein
MQRLKRTVMWLFNCLGLALLGAGILAVPANAPADGGGSTETIDCSQYTISSCRVNTTKILCDVNSSYMDCSITNVCGCYWTLQDGGGYRCDCLDLLSVN